MINKLKEIIRIFYTDLEKTEASIRSDLIKNTVYCICIAFIMGLLAIANSKTSSLMFFAASFEAVVCFGGAIIGLLIKNRNLSSACISISLAIMFSLCIIKGGNDGFVTIWIAILPSLAMLAHGLRHGTYFSLYFLIFLYALFYTPLSKYLQYDYSPIFMNRFPILYTVSFISTFCGLFYMHKTALHNEAQRKELEELREKAEEANKTKSKFLATMSHEIRTPINGILGMNSLMMKECNDENLLQYAYNIQSSGNTLLSIVNDILDISRVESGKMEIIPVNYKLFQVLNDCYNMTVPRTNDKGLDLIMEIDEDLPSKLLGDEIRVRQVLTNILSNAAKYTKKGYVKFKLTCQNRTDYTIDLVFEISDSGIGMKEEDLGRLFHSFTRLDEKENRNIEGTGLGLNLTKNLLDLMGGSIQVSSEYGKGSVFTIVIPQKIASNEALGNFETKHKNASRKANQNEDMIKTKDARILVVDDVEINLLVVKGILKETGASVDTAMNGNECIEMLERFDYDLVFLDHMMPGMDGTEVLHEFKSHKQEHNADTPMIMLTANAIAGAKEEYLEAGFSDYLSKPVSIMDINEILIKYLPKGKIEA